MLEGFYSITFRGASDWGMGMLILQKGQVVGSDAGGVQYDGTYQDIGDSISINITMTVPPGVPLVQGIPARPQKYTVPIEATLSKHAIESSQPILLQLPPGPINVIFRQLRTLGS